MKGRPADLWLRCLDAKPTDALVEALCLAGFDGIYLDRTGYADAGAAVEARLSQLLGAPLVAGNGRQSFFSMGDYNARRRQGLLMARRDDAGVPNHVSFAWRGSFSGLESSGRDSWRWCGREGDLVVHNEGRRPVTVALE